MKIIQSIKASIKKRKDIKLDTISLQESSDLSRLALLSLVEDQKKAKEELHRLNEELEERILNRTGELEQAKNVAEKANQSKNLFLANMSHEIYTPMNAILGYADLLSSMVMDKTQKHYVESIAASGRILLTLINNILDLSKIEADKLQLESEYINTSIFFTDLERIFALKVEEKNLTFTLDIAQEMPGGIYVDETRLRQIMFNLIGNAIKFTDRGFVAVKVYPGKLNDGHNLAGTKGSIELVIEVSDSGIGISREYENEIFDPFTQQHGQKKYGGTGLGLAITKRLVSLMKGTISFESQLNKGTSFRVLIPDIAWQTDSKSAVAMPSSSAVPSVEGITDINGLIHSLEGEFTDTRKSFTVRQPVIEVREFGKRLAALGMKHKAEGVIGYGRELSGSADSFNVRTMLALLGRFPDMAEELKLALHMK